MSIVSRPVMLGSRAMTVDSVAVVASFFVTAGAGMLFWVVSARVIPPHALGIQTALLSLVTTVGTITAYGVGSAYKAMLSTPDCPRRERLLEGLLITIGSAAVFGVMGGMIAGDMLENRVATVVLVACGSVVMALFVLKDAALIGLHASRWLPIVNVAAVVLKVALVCVLASVVALAAVWATIVPALLGACVVFVVLVPRILRRPENRTSPHRVVVVDRGQMPMFALRDGIGSATSFGLILVLPFLTTLVAGPVAGATLALALAVAQVLDFVPDGIGAALTAHLARDPAALAGQIRRIWAISQCLVVVGAGVLIAASPIVGKIFGPAYSGSEFTTSLCLLAAASVLRVPYSIWMSVLRAELDTKTILRCNTVVFVITFPVTLVLAGTWGSIGAGSGLLVSSLLLGAVGTWDLRRRWLSNAEGHRKLVW
ncbi:lipopolysaccharide biosynthesis protein [Gordonia sp. p3-SID1431]|uniref:lipopolysaccharide biosynthesis protein n=1 Tax=Gordonia sp. p3-SID1431 TaxID=2916159 RepID=UPI0021A2603B|nr:hypothetical protein [Gordonia sp. p3-SID1431]MCT1355324.1 hypothetical protein [Gordonia sp. p3-SID1431]